MKRNFLYISLFLTSLLALTACSEEEHDIPVDQKTPIQLSVGNVSGTATSRAITTDPTEASLKTSLPVGTTLYMVMKSEKNNDDALWTLTKGTTVTPESEGKPNVSFGSGCIRYWDDAHARDARLSIYSVCTPGGTPNTIKIGGSDSYSPTITSSTKEAWNNTTNSLTISDWTVNTDQKSLTEKTFADQDLCYSNNLSQYKIGDATTDARLHFDSSSKKFTGGNMNFYHALSKITFVVQKGESFSDTEFQFAEGTNIAMKGMNISNTSFNIESGEFTGTYGTGNITKMYQRSFENNKYTLDALVLPGTDMNNTDEDGISFTIANNVYKLTKKALLDAIPADDKTNKMLSEKCLKPGVHYTFNLTISKTQVIRITASLVNWQTVTSEEIIPSNARISIETTKLGDNMVQQFDLYRKLDTDNKTIDSYIGYEWTSGYSAESGYKTTVSYDNTNTKWNLAQNWYWNNNVTYYHFRSVAPTGTTINDTKSIPLTSNEPAFTDVIWGAPFIKNLSTIKYSTTDGFDGSSTSHQIYYAIGPTNSDINLTMFHMMSKVKFNIQTNNDPEGSSVTLTKTEGENTKYCTITLKSIKKNGTVAMGNGLVTATSTPENWKFTQTPTENTGVYSWSAGIVPQSLADVVLEIVTPDNNKYEIALKDVKANSVTAANISIANVENGKAIDYWYPCFEYTYTITLKKTGIENITATLVDWQKVSADNQTVVIK